MFHKNQNTMNEFLSESDKYRMRMLQAKARYNEIHKCNPDHASTPSVLSTFEPSLTEKRVRRATSFQIIDHEVLDVLEKYVALYDQEC